MVDSSWDNSGAPAPRKGMSVWAKIGLGCGVAFLALALLCGGCTFFLYQKTRGTLDTSWSEMRAAVDSLRTEEGARRLYAANPGLKENYATEAEFLKAAQEWRPRLGAIPQQRPDFKALFADHQLEYNVRNVNGRKAVTIRYRFSQGARLLLEQENDKVVDIRVE